MNSSELSEYTNKTFSLIKVISSIAALCAGLGIGMCIYVYIFMQSINPNFAARVILGSLILMISGMALAATAIIIAVVRNKLINELQKTIFRRELKEKCGIDYTGDV